MQRIPVAFTGYTYGFLRTLAQFTAPLLRTM